MVHNAIFPDLRSFFWKSESAKMTQNGLSSPNCIFWLQPYRSFQKSPRNLRGINYQMEHMWWAPHMHNNSPRLQEGPGPQWSSTLFCSFIVTLYVTIYPIIEVHIIELWVPCWTLKPGKQRYPPVSSSLVYCLWTNVKYKLIRSIFEFIAGYADYLL